MTEPFFFFLIFYKHFYISLRTPLCIVERVNLTEDQKPTGTGAGDQVEDELHGDHTEVLQTVKKSCVVPRKKPKKPVTKPVTKAVTKPVTKKTELCPECGKACSPKGLSSHRRQKHPESYKADKHARLDVLPGAPDFAQNADKIPVHDYSGEPTGKPVGIVITMEGEKIALYTDEKSFIGALEGVNTIMPMLGEKGLIIQLDADEIGSWGPLFYRYLRRNHTKFLNNIDENIIFYAITAKIFIPRFNRMRGKQRPNNDNTPFGQILPIKEPGNSRENGEGKNALANPGSTITPINGAMLPISRSEGRRHKSG